MPKLSLTDRKILPAAIENLKVIARSHARSGLKPTAEEATALLAVIKALTETCNDGILREQANASLGSGLPRLVFDDDSD